MSIKYIEGDLFKHVESLPKPVAIPHVCNDLGHWGKGFVVPLAKAFPEARFAFLDWSMNKLNEKQFVLGNTQLVQELEVVIFNMVAQHKTGGVRPLRYNALAKCMDFVGEMCLLPKLPIVAPMFGAGLAGGDWNFIEKLIQDCWLNIGLDVTICYLANSLPDNWNPPQGIGDGSV